MPSDDVARALLEAAWLTARIAAAFALGLAFGAMLLAATRAHRAADAGDDAPPRARRPGAGPRIAAQLAALALGVVVTTLTAGQAQAWLPAPLEAVVATVAALAVLFAGTFVAWSAWTLGPAFAAPAVVGPRAALVTHGPFALVRHPFYTAWGLWGAGAALAFGSLAGALVFLAAWIPATRARAALEEEALAEAWPDAWPAYAARTPRFLPRW